jgi:tetratricopeptide (TPR) repeat protein
MSFWSRLGGGKSKSEQKRLDYLSEGLALERQGDYEAALTSYQLALRDQPTNHRVLQNMAIAYSRTGRQTEAIRCYRRALDLQPKLAGAHYGLAFLLLRRGGEGGTRDHNAPRRAWAVDRGPAGSSGSPQSASPCGSTRSPYSGARDDLWADP